jgi:hypothetical protein
MSSTMPAIIKTEFYGGPKDGDKEVVQNKLSPRYYDSRAGDSVHTYCFTADNNRMDYFGLVPLDTAPRGTVLPLVVGQRN